MVTDGENRKADEEGRLLLLLHPGFQRLRPGRPSGAGKSHLYAPAGNDREEAGKRAETAGGRILAGSAQRHFA